MAPAEGVISARTATAATATIVWGRKRKAGRDTAFSFAQSTGQVALYPGNCPVKHQLPLENAYRRSCRTDATGIDQSRHDVPMRATWHDATIVLTGATTGIGRATAIAHYDERERQSPNPQTADPAIQDRPHDLTSRMPRDFLPA